MMHTSVACTPMCACSLARGDVVSVGVVPCLADDWHIWMAFVPGGILARFHIGGIADMCVFGVVVHLTLLCMLCMIKYICIRLAAVRQFVPPRCRKAA